MRKAKHGKVATINDLREALAKKRGTDMARLTKTGIFALIAAEVSALAGHKNTISWWRTLKTGGELNPKYHGRILF